MKTSHCYNNVFIPAPCTYTTVAHRWQGYDLILVEAVGSRISIMTGSITIIPPYTREEQKQLDVAGIKIE